LQKSDKIECVRSIKGPVREAFKLFQLLLRVM